VSIYNFSLPLFFEKQLSVGVLESYVLICIFSLLKIWNLNKCSGVVGVFNCQGAGWCKIEKKNRIHCETPGTLSGSVCTSDVDLIAQVAGADWNGDAVVYAYRSGNFIGHKISEFQGVE
jgi:hypothetical protein